MTLSARQIVRLAFGLLAIAAAATSGCARSAKDAGAKVAEPEAPPVDVKLVAAHEIKIPRVLTLSGSLIGAEDSQVAAGAAGKITATYVERGSVVKKGSVLARLDGRILSAQTREANAQVESLKLQQSQAELDCQRTQQLFDKGALSRADYDKVHTQCATAKWTLAAAEARKMQMNEALHDTEIRAPFAGMVVERTVSPGEYVRPDSRVVTLVAVDALRVELTVPEADVGQIKVGQTIDFKVPALVNGTRHKGVVKYIGPAVRQQSRDAIVEAVVENPGHELRPGMFVSAQVALGERPCPAVPASAVRSEGNQRRVFVARTAASRSAWCRLGRREGGEVPILDGIKGGEQVVADVDTRSARRRARQMLSRRPPCSGLAQHQRQAADLRDRADPAPSLVVGIVGYGKLERRSLSQRRPARSCRSPRCCRARRPRRSRPNSPTRVEEAVNTISGIDELRSTSTEGVSQVFITFLLDKNIDVAAQEVRDHLATILRDLPEGTETPVVSQAGSRTRRRSSASRSSRRRPIREITELADKKIRQALENISGVGQVTIVGGRKRQIQVLVDPTEAARRRPDRRSTSSARSWPRTSPRPAAPSTPARAA